MARKSRIVINLAAVQSSIELHNLLMEQLDFPGWYGHNWDAFWDAITASVEMPEILQLNGWETLKSRLPDDAKLMEECLVDMTFKYPQAASKVVYA